MSYRRRYLDTARISFAAIEHSNSVNSIPDSIVEADHVRENIARYLNIPWPENISFRSNTTQAFRDLLISSVSLHDDNIRILASDIDHPVMLQMIRAFEKNIELHIVPLQDQMCFHTKESEINIVDSYSIKVQEVNPDIVLVPHVDYLTGSVFPITCIANITKKNNSNTVVVIDGAQAIGNILLEIDWYSIDAYLCCTQKWVGASDPVGILAIGESYLHRLESNNLHKSMYINDIFSVFAGTMVGGAEFALDTYQIGILYRLAVYIAGFKEQESCELLPIHHSDEIRDIVQMNSSLHVCGNLDSSSSIVSITGKNEITSNISKALNRKGYAHSTFHIDEAIVLRLCAPFKKFTIADRICFESIIMSVE